MVFRRLNIGARINQAIHLGCPCSKCPHFVAAIKHYCLINALTIHVGLATSEQRSGLRSDFQCEPEILALLGVDLHTKAKWIEAIHSDLEIVDIAALHRGE